MEENLERDFKGIWISKEIWLNEDLSAIEKVLLSEIDSLDCGDGGCYASNDYLAKFCKCDSKTISRGISKLKDLGLIEIVSFDGRHRRVHSRLDKLSRQGGQIVQADQTKCPAINIDNNKDNNIVNINRKTKFEKPTLDEIEKYIKEKKLSVNGKDFYEYFEEGNWIDSKGNKVKNWKQKLLTWNKYKAPKQSGFKSLEVNSNYVEDFNTLYDN